MVCPVSSIIYSEIIIFLKRHGFHSNTPGQHVHTICTYLISFDWALDFNNIHVFNPSLINQLTKRYLLRERILINTFNYYYYFKS